MSRAVRESGAPGPYPRAELMSRLLVIKTGALGDVLRTTSILPGLAERSPALELTWVTATGAGPLLAGHPHVAEVIEVDPRSPEALGHLEASLAEQAFDRILSLDDEEPLCRLASALAERTGATPTGAVLGPDGQPAYTDDAACWFGMGLLCREGLAEADRRKLANRRTHAELLAEVVGVRPDRPHLELEVGERAAGASRAEALAGPGPGPLIGLNTGAGGRWATKAMRVEEVARLAALLASSSIVAPRLVLLGGPDEVARNGDLAAGSARRLPASAGRGASISNCGSSPPWWAPSTCSSPPTASRSMGVAQARRVVAALRPDLPHEIDLFGRGEKVVSTAPTPAATAVTLTTAPSRRSAWRPPSSGSRRSRADPRARGAAARRSSRLTVGCCPGKLQACPAGSSTASPRPSRVPASWRSSWA